jgi:FkbM family methyltransferase
MVKKNEDIGQQINYGAGYDVPLITLDSLDQPHVDLVKIDVEGMEEAVIAGGLETLRRPARSCSSRRSSRTSAACIGR